jgi:muramidase (phage lysozyme)
MSPEEAFLAAQGAVPKVPAGLQWNEGSQIARDGANRRYAMVPVPRHLEEYRRNFGLTPRNAQVQTVDAPPRSRPPAASGAGDTIPPEAYALLDTISGTESAGKYNVMYGGKRFADYSDHPRVAFPIQSGPNRGKRSSAAGRYQFIQGTWDNQARKLGLQDFSPLNQDRAAWNLASETYGRGLLDALRSGNPQRIADVGRALRKQWTSLPGGIEAGTNSSRFAKAYADHLARRSGSKATAARSPEESFLAQYLGN